MKPVSEMSTGEFGAFVVAREHPIDVNEIERWSTHEGMHEEFVKIRIQFERGDE